MSYGHNYWPVMEPDTMPTGDLTSHDTERRGTERWENSISQ